MNFFKTLREESRNYGVPFWKLPDFILLAMAIANIFVMVVTYAWAAWLAKDPAEAVLLVAAEAVLIIVVGNGLVESAKKIMDINRLRYEFVHIISHQMRSPLTAVRWYLEILNAKSRGKFDEKQREYLDKIFEENEKLRTMVYDLLNMARLEGRSTASDQEKLELNSLVSECWNNLLGYAQIKKVTMKFDFKKKKVLVRGNAEKMKIVIINLMENAVRYSPAGSQILTSVKKKREMIQLSIKDAGIGIDEKDAKYIFNKFFRSDNAKHAEPEGTGLGLYVSKKIIEQMKGRISFESKLNEGTEFLVELPVE